MADDEAVATAAEAAICDEGDFFAETHAHDGAGGPEHFAHAWAAARSFHADDDDVTGFDFAFGDGFHGVFFAVEDAGFAAEATAFLAADFADGSAWGEISVEDGEVAVFLDGVGEWADDILTFWVGFDLGEIFREGFAGDGHDLAVEEAGFEEHLHEGESAADADEFPHNVFSGGFEVGEDGRAGADLLEVVDGEFDAGLVGHGWEVEDGVGAAAECGDDGDGVEEGFAAEDVGGFDAALEEVHDGGTGVEAVHHFFVADGGLGGGVREGEAEGFDGAGHGVGGVHAAAGAWAGDGALFDVGEGGVGDFAAGVLADGFEDRDDVDVAAVMAAWFDGAAVDEDAGAVETGHGHDAGGHVFVAAADGDEPVEHFASGDGFDGIGDDFAGDEAVFHAFGAHGDAVRDGDGVEDDAFTAGRVDAFGGFEGELIDVDVAGSDLAPCAGDADLAFFEVCAFEADGVEHGAGGGAFRAVDQLAGELAGVGGGGGGRGLLP